MFLGLASCVLRPASCVLRLASCVFHPAEPPNYRGLALKIIPATRATLRHFPLSQAERSARRASYLSSFLVPRPFPSSTHLLVSSSYRELKAEIRLFKSAKVQAPGQYLDSPRRGVPPEIPVPRCKAAKGKLKKAKLQNKFSCGRNLIKGLSSTLQPHQYSRLYDDGYEIPSNKLWKGCICWVNKCEGVARSQTLIDHRIDKLTLKVTADTGSGFGSGGASASATGLFMIV